MNVSYSGMHKVDKYILFKWCINHLNIKWEQLKLPVQAPLWSHPSLIFSEGPVHVEHFHLHNLCTHTHVHTHVYYILYAGTKFICFWEASIKLSISPLLKSLEDNKVSISLLFQSLEENTNMASRSRSSCSFLRVNKRFSWHVSG